MIARPPKRWPAREFEGIAHDKAERSCYQDFVQIARRKHSAKLRMRELQPASAGYGARIGPESKQHLSFRGYLNNAAAAPTLTDRLCPPSAPGRAGACAA
jgi:hypothetical protein